ncbi:uncharacterized protein LOC132059626 isoform X2 [Lycium ferocissimum]|uniref:uncharacterized protein LOC132059626 isoform X2 n=1 Tax=Lycium ferocissimum TaxID=112874 RepID=UPI0028169699|nr:uncharacterized protein LOC132059626 isoform X2 [Lycium ferocissimum]XP_059308283.1 uncharacterized protein LOC132059626 isoform X2 [Lycium ferocissimum]
MDRNKTTDQMQVNEKDVQLLEKQLKRKRSKRQCIPTNPTTVESVEPSASFRKEPADYDEQNSLAAARRHENLKSATTEHDVCSIINTCHDESTIVRPSSVFEKGSTSRTCNDQHNIPSQTIKGLDQRVYNLPTASEVAAIWIEQDNNSVTHTPHIRIYTHNNRSQLVNYYYGCYDALQYPLIFPYGQNG